MNLSTLTEALVMRGYCKCDSEGDGDVRVHTPPAGGHYWHLLPAHHSEDGTAWLWVTPPQDEPSDVALTFQASTSGTLLTASLQDTAIGKEVACLFPIPADLGTALSLWQSVVDVWAEACSGEATLSDKELAELLKAKLPEGAYLSHDLEVA
jgi:hypothetical protein